MILVANLPWNVTSVYEREDLKRGSREAMKCEALSTGVCGALAEPNKNSSRYNLRI